MDKSAEVTRYLSIITTCYYSARHDIFLFRPVNNTFIESASQYRMKLKRKKACINEPDMIRYRSCRREELVTTKRNNWSLKTEQRVSRFHESEVKTNEKSFDRE